MCIRLQPSTLQTQLEQAKQIDPAIVHISKLHKEWGAAEKKWQMMTQRIQSINASSETNTSGSKILANLTQFMQDYRHSHTYTLIRDKARENFLDNSVHFWIHRTKKERRNLLYTISPLSQEMRRRVKACIKKQLPRPSGPIFKPPAGRLFPIQEEQVKYRSAKVTREVGDNILSAPKRQKL